MKRHLYLLFLIIAAISQSAHADDKVLQVVQTNGEVINIKLKEEPVTTYSNGNLVIRTTKTTITYPLEQVKCYKYKKVTDGICPQPSMETTFSEDGETLFFKGLKPNTRIAVYSTSGQLVHMMNSGEQNMVTVTISSLPTGVYIVKANDVTYKISKR